jgi:hypothetical protein
MPDLQSELAKINAAIKDLKFDDEEEGDAEPEPVAVTDNIPVVEQVFHYVKAHPGCSLTEVNKGLRLTGASSSLKSLTDRGILRRTESKDGGFRYFAVSAEYKAISRDERVALMRAAREARLKARAEGAASSASAKLAKKRAKQREYNRRHQEKLKAAAKSTTHQPPAAPAPQPTPPVAPVRIVNSIDELLDTLSVKQARELYDRLKQMFGG